MASSSWRTYQTALQSCNRFLQSYGLPTALPLQPASVALYLSYLHEKGYSPSTMPTHISAIAHIHHLLGLSDPTDSFIVKKVIQGAKHMNPTCDSRLPITLPILSRLVDSLGHVCVTPWCRTLYRSMFLMAFFGFLRVGEMTAATNASHNTLTFDCISPVTGTSKLKLQFRRFKHSKKPAAVIIEPQANSRYCPVHAWTEYAKLRGAGPGFMFLGSNAEPISRRAFADQLALCLKACQLSPTLYKTHSFRIGAATYAAENGYSALQIQALGRWSSAAFLKYIRL